MAHLLKFGFMVAVLVASQPSHAKWYGNVSAGTSSKHISDNSFAVTGATAYSIKQGNKGPDYKIQAGYQISPNWAVEVGYVNLGRITATNFVTAPGAGTYGVKAKADGWNAFALGSFPLTNAFSLIGKLGAIYSTTSVSATSSGTVTISGNTGWKMREANWAYGLGAEYGINSTLSLRGEWERFNGFRVADKSGNNNIDLYSMGLKLMF